MSVSTIEFSDMDEALTAAERAWNPQGDGDFPDDIIIKFANSLRDDQRDWLYEFHFACHQREIIWDDCDNYRMETKAPAVVVGFEILDMSDGRFAGLAPQAMHHLLFAGPYRRAVDAALKNALMLEHQRTTDPENSDRYLPVIERELINAKAAIFANWEASSPEDLDVFPAS